MITSLQDAARAHLPAYGLPASAQVRLLNHSENTTFLVGEKLVMRVHRVGYHTRNGIASELAWMEALRRQTPIRTPRPIAALSGELITKMPVARGEPRHCVAFEFLEGHEPSEADLASAYRLLGEISARFHRQAESWSLPPGFERLTWDFEHMLGGSPNWGDWHDAPFLDARAVELLERQAGLIERRLAQFGKARDRFGLIHADLRLANLLLHDGSIRVLDFDDSGFGWFLYDLASALSFMEDRPDIDRLIAAWLEGYRAIRPLSAAEEAEIGTFLMLRRMVILAWMGTHAETDLSKSLGADYVRGSCRLAEKYLSDFG
jgi:Ser/Thr protein kinase RdoA (MazF antagonist)